MTRLKLIAILLVNLDECERRGGLMVSLLDAGLSSPGSSPALGHCVVFGLSAALP